MGAGGKTGVGGRARSAATAAALLVLAGCVGDGGPGADTAVACVVPRLAASPQVPERANRPGQPPVPALSDAELAALAACVRPQLVAAFRTSEAPAARHYGSWPLFTSQPFGSEHGHYLEIFANERAAALGRFEEAGVLPEGAAIAKPHFTVTGDGKVHRGPLLVMEKKEAGFSPRTGDWRFTMVAPDGSIAGETNGRDAAAVEFCLDCHRAARRQDFLLLVPPRYRRPD